jgi:hypothetical protein
VHTVDLNVLPESNPEPQKYTKLHSFIYQQCCSDQFHQQKSLSLVATATSIFISIIYKRRGHINDLVAN